MRKPWKTGNLVEEEGRIYFADDIRGTLRIYEKPREHAVIGADVAEGIEEDQCAAIVLGTQSNATLAAFNSGTIDPDEFAIFLRRLSIYYLHAFLGVERNSVGFSVVSDLLKIYSAKHIYFHTRLDEKKKKKTKKFGWLTNEHTRHLMLGYLKQEVREGSTELRDKPLIKQCMRFMNIDGKPQHASGEKDDLVLARAIAGMMKREKPVRTEELKYPHETKKPY